MNTENPTPKPLKGVIASIFRTDTGTDYSNQGMSSRVSHVVVIGPGIDEVLPATEQTPAVRLVAREGLGDISYHAEPFTTGPACWWMHGGTYIHTNDSRFRAAVNHNGAVPFHDRAE